MKINLGENIQHIHFIGIGGISMSGLAEILYKDGYTVSGSDWTESDITKHLASLGLDFKLGNDALHVTEEIDLVVYTAAVKANNPELVAAKAKNIPTMDRARLLGLVMKGYENSIAVAGVHGKTTTTAIVSQILLAAEKDPTILIGGFMESIRSNFRIGQTGYLVAEACEYFDSFLQFHPHVGIILNVEADHLDYFGTFERMLDSFHKFAQNIPSDGTLVIHGGIDCLDQIVDGLKCNIVTYGTDDSDFQAEEVRYSSDGLPSFKCNGLEISLKMRGRHNIDNSLAAIAVATALNVPSSAIIYGLKVAVGAKRRFEHKGMYKGITIVDDYAHHPTEIKASLSSVVGVYKRVICAFQSHTYSRTQNLMDDFSSAFEHTDHVLILPIFASRELPPPVPNYLAELLTENINKNGKKATFCDGFGSAADWIKSNCLEGDLLITMGAGDIHLLGEGLLSD